MFNYQVNLVDPANAGGSADGVLVYDLQQALSEWSKYISGQGTIIAELRIATTAEGRESGGPTSTFFVGTQGARNVFESSAEYELATGKHVTGTSSDIIITVDPRYLNQLSLQGGLTTESPVETGRYNPISVFMHEIGHGLGVISYYSDAGVLPASYESNYDALIQFSGGHPYFTGSTAKSVYGGPVPVTDNTTQENFSHFGTTISDLNVSGPSSVTDPLTLDLLNGIVLFHNYNYQISDLDLSVLRDLGLSSGRPLVGTSGDDVLHVSTIVNSVNAGAGNDVIFIDGGGARFIDGGDGLDAVIFPGPKSAFSISVASSTVSNAGIGVQTLANVERLQFSDTTLALDIQGDAGNAYRLYQAAFNRTPDTPGLSFWTHQLDHGIDIQAVAAGFVNSSEFQSVYGVNPTHPHIVDLLYHNVLGRNGETAGTNYWIGQLDRGVSVGEVLEGFAVSSENHGIVDPKIAQGIILDHTAFLV
jgi:hypothetical protein